MPVHQACLGFQDPLLDVHEPLVDVALRVVAAHGDLALHLDQLEGIVGMPLLPVLVFCLRRGMTSLQVRVVPVDMYSCSALL